MASSAKAVRRCRRFMLGFPWACTMDGFNTEAEPGMITMEKLLASCPRGGMSCIVLLLVLALSWPMAATTASTLAVPATQNALTEAAKIQALISTVEKSHGLVFIRNGSTHDPAQAASHLRLKWKNAGKRVHTAEDFIRYCATGSSLSGKPYRIQFADGRTEQSAVYFHAQLRRIEAGPVSAAAIKSGAAKPKP